MKNFCEDLFFLRALALVSLVLGLGLEHSCSWPRECLSSERLSWPWPWIFFVSLALASSLVSSTPPLLISIELQNWLPVIHFARHNIDVATAGLEDYGAFAVARYQISIRCYITIVHFLVFDVCFLCNKKLNFFSVLSTVMK